MNVAHESGKCVCYGEGLREFVRGNKIECVCLCAREREEWSVCGCTMELERKSVCVSLIYIYI